MEPFLMYRTKQQLEPIIVSMHYRNLLWCNKSWKYKFLHGVQAWYRGVKLLAHENYELDVGFTL